MPFAQLFIFDPAATGGQPEQCDGRYSGLPVEEPAAGDRHLPGGGARPLLAAQPLPQPLGQHHQLSQAEAIPHGRPGLAAAGPAVCVAGRVYAQPGHHPC